MALTSPSLYVTRRRSSGPSHHRGFCCPVGSSGNTAASDAHPARHPLPGSAGYTARRSGDTIRRSPGRGGPPQFPSPPSERSAPSTPRSSSGLRFQALHPFHGLRPDRPGSAPPLPTRRWATNDAAGFASRYGPLSCSPQRGFRRWASTRSVSRPSRQPATGPPDSYPDRTSTGKRR